MRKFFMLALTAAAVGMASVGSLGCSSGDGSGGSGGGNGGEGGSGGGNGGNGGNTSSTGTTSSTTGTTSSTTSNTTGADCEGVLMNPNDCGNCIIDQCCTELAQCGKDAECNDCLSNPNADPAACDANAQLGAVFDCAGTLCSDVCGGGGGAEPACDAPATSPSAGACVTLNANNKCNPVTNEGCDTAAGAACDANNNGFECYPSQNVHAICEACGSAGDGEYCKPGMTCVGKCARYCCEDTDCGTGKCTKNVFADANVGFCEAL